MEFFNQIYSKYKIAVIIFMFIASIIAYGALGYAFGRHEQIDSAPADIKFIPDINPGVCAVDIDNINDFGITGRIGEKHVRVRYKGGIVVPNRSRQFFIAR